MLRSSCIDVIMGLSMSVTVNQNLSATIRRCPLEI